jgi:hypothetical protein
MAARTLILVLIALAPAAGAPLRIGTDEAHAEFGAAVQLRTTTTSDFAAPPRQELEIRRLRFSLRGEAPEVRFALQLNTTPRALELLDAWMEWRPDAALALRAGQTKTPLTRHRQQRFSELAFPEWGTAVFHFGAERQIGLLARLGGEHGPLRFDGGVFTGRNARATFERGVADTWGVPLPNPSDLRAPPAPPAFHPECVGRVSGSSQPTGTERSVDASGGPLRVVGSLGGAWDLAPSRRREYRGRVAPELLVQFQHWALDLGGYFGWAHLDGAEVALASIGANAELTRWIDPGLLLGLRWSSVTRQPAFLSSVQSVTGHRPVPTLHELTFAMGLPLGGELLRLQVEGSWVHDEADALRVRAQLQLAW